MEIHETILPPSLSITGQIRGKPKIILAPGVVQRLTLRKPLDIAIARTTVRKLSGELGYSLIDQVRLATAIFVLADNIVTYAGQGEIVIFWREDAQRKGLQFFCNDQGRHAPELTTILQIGDNETHSKQNFLGLKQLVDEFEFTEDSKHGNCVTIAIWLEEAE